MQYRHCSTCVTCKTLLADCLRRRPAAWSSSSHGAFSPPALAQRFGQISVCRCLYHSCCCAPARFLLSCTEMATPFGVHRSLAGIQLQTPCYHQALPALLGSSDPRGSVRAAPLARLTCAAAGDCAGHRPYPVASAAAADDLRCCCRPPEDLLLRGYQPRAPFPGPPTSRPVVWPALNIACTNHGMWRPLQL